LPLYESILVFENYPVERSELMSSNLTIDLSGARFIGAQTTYALTILVLPGSALEVKIIYDRARFDDADVTLMRAHLGALFQAITTAPDQPIGALIDQIPAAQIPKVRPLRLRSGQAQLRMQQDLKARFVAPRTSTETILAAIWKGILGLEQIGIHDNFFDLGGHSIIAMQLMVKIQQQFGKSFPVTAFFQAPTIAQFAQRISQQELPEAFTPLVGIQPHGANLPFFCMHAVDGGVFYYNDLARLMGTKQPFYALQASGLEPGTPILTRFEDMAAEYIKAIRSVHPQGPYLVGGYSLGGIIAYEVAQQLRRSGAQVALVAIIDITPQYTVFEGANHFFAFMKAISGLLKIDLFPFYREIRGIDVHAGDEGIRKDLQSLSGQERLTMLWECIQKTGSLPPGLDPERIDRAMSVFNANTEAVRTYPVQPYHGRIALFRSLHDLVQKLDDPTFGWGQYTATPIEIYDLPGDHFSIIREPHVTVLAEKLRVCLEHAQMNITHP